MDRKIQLSNFPDVDGFKKDKINHLIESTYDKLAMRLHGEMFMEAHYKVASKGGTRKLVEFHAKIVVNGKKFAASHSDWDAEAATHHVMQSLMKEVEKFKK